MSASVLQEIPQDVDGGSTTAKQSNAFTSSPTVGSTLLAGISWGADLTNLPSSVVDDQGQTYTLVSNTDVYDASNQGSQAVYAKQNNASALVSKITANWSSAQSFTSIWIVEIGGVSSTSVQGGNSNDQFQPGPGSDAISSGTITPTGAPYLIWALCQDVSGASPPASAGTGFTAGPTGMNFGGNPIARSESLRVATGLTAKAATFTDAALGAGSTYLTSAVILTEGSGGGTFTLSASSGSYAFTGKPQTLTFFAATSYSIIASNGLFNFSGAPSFSDSSLAASTGGFAYTGQAVTLNGVSAYSLSAAHGVYTLTGESQTLTPNTNAVLVASHGTYTFTGQGQVLVANTGGGSGSSGSGSSGVSMAYGFIHLGGRIN